MSLRIDFSIFFFQAEDGIRDLVRSRGLGDVYKRQLPRTEMKSTQRIARINALLSRPQGATMTQLIEELLSLIHI